LKSCLGIWRFMRENQGGERKKKYHWLPTKVLSTTRVVISVWLLSDVAHVALTMRPPLRAIYISIIFKNNIYIFIILKLSLHLYDNKIKTQMKI
jgi:SH3-like domain-containing protein